MDADGECGPQTLAALEKAVDVVKGVKKGTAKITVTTANGKKATVKVKVN